MRARYRWPDEEERGVEEESVSHCEWVDDEEDVCGRVGCV